jgi:hypothetical protein
VSFGVGSVFKKASFDANNDIGGGATTTGVSPRFDERE